MGDGRYRNRQVNFRVTDAEYESLCRKAKRHDMSVAKYIREALIHASARPSPTINVSPLLSIDHELKKQGTNLNQLMYFLNANGIEGYNADEVRHVLGLKGEAYLKVANAIGDLRDEAERHHVTILAEDSNDEESEI